MGPFVYGVATSAFQVEGATDADGRGPSIWDTFAAQPGAIVDGSDGRTACGSYERWADDLDLLAELGVGAYRFSIAWPRVQPEGSGPINTPGLDYYDRVVDALCAKGIQPLPTLYHWDLPQSLEDDGGWPSRETALRFADYAAAVHGRLSDRVGVWATLNEPWCSAFLGYAAGVHAPGRREPGAAYAAAHNLLLAHALAAATMREQHAESKVGLALNLTTVHTDDLRAVEAARFVDAVRNRLWLDPLLDGRYPADLLEAVPVLEDPEVVDAGDLTLVAGSADWIGVNYYNPLRVGSPEPGADDSDADPEVAAYPGALPLRFRPREPRTPMGWEVDPGGLTDVLVELAARDPRLVLRVTENGAAYGDGVIGPDGRIDDADRAAYLQAHIAAVHAARAAGADVRAYLAWTLLDNFEWSHGYTQRFGLVAVEPGTLARVPKRSFAWYADLIRAGAPAG
ncbi:MAG TPA: GH1 family beta-glucosidase [Actinomycetes bacterium]|nr:GH1 family beta-glucosidase [Actinomycetes bacterium]